MRWIPSVVSALALATVASAQGELVVTINQSQSNFNWSGTTSIGALVGNPSTAFQAAGTANVRIFPLANDSIASADFPGAGDAAVVPDLHGKINNVFPFLPPLATFDVTNLHLQFSSPVFTVAANGAFTASLTVTALSGQMTVTPLGSAATVSDLTGLVSAPTNQNGTLTLSGAVVSLVMPVNSTFPFSDPASGVSGSLSITGTVRGSWTCPAPTVYCTAKTNSLGCVPSISTTGTAKWFGNSPFLVQASNVLNQKNGLLFYGYAASATPFQGGTKCVAPPTLRTGAQNSGGSGSGNDCSGTYAFDMNAVIASQLDPLLVPGAQVYAQVWSRDPGSPSTTGLTNAVAFTVCP